MLRRLLRADAGQSSVDYVTILAITGLLLTAGTGLAMAQGGAIAGAVGTQMARALCIVSGGDCERDRAPCVVSSEEKSSSKGGRILIVRLGGTRSAVISERSDGLVDVTLSDEVEGGVDFSLSREARLAAMAKLKGGMSWTVASLEEARELVDRVGNVSRELARSLVDRRFVSDPDEISLEGGVSVGVSIGGEVGGVGGKGTVERDVLAGGRRNRRTGHTVLYLKNAKELLGSLKADLPVGEASGALDLEASTELAVEVDREGRPVDLMLLQSRAYDGSFSLPGVASEVAGYLGVPSRHARRVEVEYHLDLTQPDNFRAAEGFLAGALALKMVNPVVDGLPETPLALLLFRKGTADVRMYEFDRSRSSSGFSIKVAGYEREKEETRNRLLAAVSRSTTGTWTERTDCVAR